jgi:methyl-accepting chemotaxis protein
MLYRVLIVPLQLSRQPIQISIGSLFGTAESTVFNSQKKAKIQNALAQVDAINKSQAVIEFKLDGTIVTANQNFLDAVGYTTAEIQGKHHSMFVDKAERESTAYREF